MSGPAKRAKVVKAESPRTRMWPLCCRQSSDPSCRETEAPPRRLAKGDKTFRGDTLTERLVTSKRNRSSGWMRQKHEPVETNPSMDGGQRLGRQRNSQPRRALRPPRAPLARSGGRFSRFAMSSRRSSDADGVSRFPATATAATPPQTSRRFRGSPRPPDTHSRSIGNDPDNRTTIAMGNV